MHDHGFLSAPLVYWTGTIYLLVALTSARLLVRYRRSPLAVGLWFFALSVVFLLCTMTGYLPTLAWWPISPMWTHVALNLSGTLLLVLDYRYKMLERIFRAEGVIASHESGMRLFASQASVPIAYVPPTGPITGATITWANDSFLRRFEVTMEVLSSRPYEEFIAKEDTSRTQRYTTSIDRGGRPGTIRNAWTKQRSGELAYNLWEQVGDTGYWIAHNMDDAVRAERSERDVIDGILDRHAGRQS